MSRAKRQQLLAVPLPISSRRFPEASCGLCPMPYNQKDFPHKATMPKTRSGKQFADQLKTCQEMAEHGTSEPRRQEWIGCVPTYSVSGTGALPAADPPPLDDTATATAPPPATSEATTST